jgi:hypothetical protein
LYLFFEWLECFQQNFDPGPCFYHAPTILIWPHNSRLFFANVQNEGKCKIVVSQPFNQREEYLKFIFSQTYTLIIESIHWLTKLIICHLINSWRNSCFLIILWLQNKIFNAQKKNVGSQSNMVSLSKPIDIINSDSFISWNRESPP